MAQTIASLRREITRFYPKRDSDDDISIRVASVAEYSIEQKKVADELNDSRYTLSTSLAALKVATTVIDVIAVNTIQILCFCDPTHPKTEEVYMRHKLIRMVRRLQCLRTLFASEKAFTIYFVPTFDTRALPTKSRAEISTDHINGGVTRIVSNAIYVYRLEESDKVMLHETLHHMPIHSIQWDATEIERLTGINDLLINEAVVECWAEVLHVLMVAHELAFNNRVVERMLELEKRWAAEQVAKLKRHFRGGEWKERTNSFCYFVIREILLRHVHEFLKMRKGMVTDSAAINRLVYAELSKAKETTSIASKAAICNLPQEVIEKMDSNCRHHRHKRSLAFTWFA